MTFMLLGKLLEQLARGKASNAASDYEYRRPYILFPPSSAAGYIRGQHELYHC